MFLLCSLGFFVCVCVLLFCFVFYCVHFWRLWQYGNGGIRNNHFFEIMFDHLTDK